MSFIIDGKGSGSRAAVTDSRLQVESNTRPFLSFKSKGAQSAFALSSEHATAGNGEIFFHMINDNGDESFVIQRVVLSTTVATWFKVFFNVDNAASSGGGVITPLNLNTGSAKAAPITSRGAGALSGITAGNLLAQVYIGAGTAVFEVEEAIIFPKDKGMHIEVDSIASSSKVNVNILGYFSDLEL